MKASEEGDGEMEKESAGAEARHARADAGDGGGPGGCAAASGRSRDRAVRAKAATVGSDANASAKRARSESRPWLLVLLSYAGRCRGKMAASLAASVASVAMGFVPFYAVYRIMEIVMGASGGEGGAGAWEAAVPWIAAAAAAYVASKVLFGVSTLLSHVSAYTILAQLRRDFAAKLMRASLGTVQGKSIGQIKNVFIDRIEGIEPPLAHMIPELSGSFLLAAGLVAWLAAIDWRMALACVATVPAGLVVFAGGLSAFNRMYAAYVEEGNRVNSVIVEYIEGIEVVKAFNQASDSYEKYAGAVRAFRDFTLGWFKATWVSMNLATSIMPTTLLAVVPVGLALYLGGELAPAELGLCLVMALAVVDPAMRLGAFLNEAKSMEYAVADADEFLRLPELPEPRERARVRGADVKLSGVRFSYEEGEEVLHGIDLTIPEGSFVALVVHGGAPCRASLGRGCRQRAHRRRGRAGHAARPAFRVGELCGPGQLPVRLLAARERAARASRRHRRGGGRRRSRRVLRRVRGAAAARMGHACGRGGQRVVGRRAPAGEHRARHAEGRAHRGARRGHGLRRSGERGPHPALDRRADARQDARRDRPPAVHRVRGRQDRRDRGRKRQGRGRARRAA